MQTTLEPFTWQAHRQECTGLEWGRCGEGLFTTESGNVSPQREDFQDKDNKKQVSHASTN